MELSFKFFRGFDNENVLNIEIRTVEVAGDIRRLRAQWTPEIVEDLQVFHNIDAEAELSVILASLISNQINTDIINTLVSLNTSEFKFGL
jgi:hypothetical protein